jgi:hypothetical protein
MPQCRNVTMWRSIHAALYPYPCTRRSFPSIWTERTNKSVTAINRRNSVVTRMGFLCLPVAVSQPTRKHEPRAPPRQGRTAPRARRVATAQIPSSPSTPPSGCPVGHIPLSGHPRKLQESRKNSRISNRFPGLGIACPNVVRWSAETSLARGPHKPQEVLAPLEVI